MQTPTLSERKKNQRRRHHGSHQQRRRCKRSPLVLFPLLSLLGIIWILETIVVVNNVSAWTATSTRATTTRSNVDRNPFHPQQNEQCLSKEKTTTTSSSSSLLILSAKTTKEEDLISETDARVLQSMLRDSNKLDLEQASNMKKLLERGVKKDEDDEGSEKEKEVDDDSEDQTYSSQVIKTLADTKFWKAFKRNAGEVFESVAIAATNQLEKSAKVLVGLGFFAWERAKQDAARALPTGGSASIPKPKQIFTMSDKSSFVEEPPTKENENLSAAARQQSLRQQFTTPGDEISAVSVEISKIFRQADQSVKMDKSKDMKNPFFAAFIERKELSESKASSSAATGDNSPFYASSQLQSTANRGSGRLDSAFKRKQKTQLAKEKENIAKKSNRLVSGAIDSAYQLNKEITSETSVPGYKTKELRASTVDVSKRIAGVAKGAAGFLNGASSFILGTGSKDKDKDQQQQQLPSAKAKVDPVEFLDDASYFAFKRERDDDTTSSTSPTFSVKQQDDEIQALEYITAEVITDRDDDTNTVNVDTNDSFNFFGSTISQSNIGGGNKKSKTSGSNPFTTNGYLDNMDSNISAETEYAYGSTTGSVFGTTDDDDGLRKVTAEVILDDDFDESLFEQAKNVDNMSIEDLLEEARIKEEEDNKEPNIITKAALRSLDVVFLVVEKFISVVPDAVSVTKRVIIRAVDSKLKDSQGSCVGWEFHGSNIRGDKRY
jgi:nucleoid DNA-binding protein